MPPDTVSDAIARRAREAEARATAARDHLDGELAQVTAELEAMP